MCQVEKTCARSEGVITLNIDNSDGAKVSVQYVLASDVHCHAWSQFSTVDEDGVNSRLQIILDELRRAAKAAIDTRSFELIIAGDLFHQRGVIKPSVMNPVMQCFREILAMDNRLVIYCLAGNHDLEGVNSDELGNAMQALGALERFYPITEPTIGPGKQVLFPWYADHNKLLEIMRAWATNGDCKDLDAIIHAPLNGVLKGIPDIGIDPEELATIGFKRVFAGHYHCHKQFSTNVWSVGATTHQTWNDPGTLAGFLLVGDSVEYVATQAPLFVDLKSPDDIDEMVISGNYVRLKLDDVTEEQIKAFRDELVEMGALGVQIIATKKQAAVRVATVKSGASLEASVAEFIDKDVAADPATKLKVQEAAAKVLMEVRSR